MKTLTIQIGNSDDKLSQIDWAQFISDMDALISCRGWHGHFRGGSHVNAPWQNYCWVVGCNSLDGFLAECRHLCSRYRQDSIAVTLGDTQFFGPSEP